MAKPPDRPPGSAQARVLMYVSANGPCLGNTEPGSIDTWESCERRGWLYWHRPDDTFSITELGRAALMRHQTNQRIKR